MKVLFLGTDAFGGRGGIANYNRCMIRALAESPHVASVKVLLLSIQDPLSVVPDGVQILEGAARSKTRFVLEALRQGVLGADLVVCGHVNLGPLARAVSCLSRAPYVVQVHGVDVWERPASRHRQAALEGASEIWSVSRFTVDRLMQWCRFDFERVRVMPNMIDLDLFKPGARNTALMQRYGLEGKQVLLTLARLDAREKYKGIDEILRVMPRMLAQRPDLAYLVVGDGDDRTRLEEKAVNLGLAESVVFTGYVSEEEKLDTIRLAQAFVMPGRGEGFGIVYLEALACGVNVVGSCLDASAEALMNGRLGAVVDPDSQESLIEGVFAALDAGSPRRDLLEHYSWGAFAQRIQGAAEAWARRVGSG